MLVNDVKLDVEKLSGSIGTVIHKAQPRDLDDATVAAIREVRLTREVVFFPGHFVDAHSHFAFGVSTAVRATSC
jgi:alpha-ketoglutarate-dependent taurine dioxygenase